MESINQFNKGLNKDTSPLFQPKHTAKELKHWVQISEDGDTYSLINENGVVDIGLEFPTGFKLIGQTILNNDIIVVLAHPSGYSQVGIIDYSKTYTRIAPSNDSGSQLGFTLDHPVDCVAKKTYAGDRVLYYTDDNVPFGSINLDNPPEDDSIEENSKLIADVTAPKILPTQIIDSGGSLYCGVYQFSIRYIKEDFSSTIILSTTQPVPIVDDLTTTSYDQKDGNNVKTLTNKAIRLSISNLDTDYTKYQIIAHRYSDDGNVLKSYALPVVTLEGSTAEYTFTDISIDAEELTLEEVRESLISYNKAKCIEQLDNRLILGNLSEATNQYDQELQEIANNILVDYKIKEELYHIAKEGSADEFDLIGAWEGEESAYFPSIAGFTFTGNIQNNPPLNTIIAYEATTTQTGQIQILDQTNILNDTITINGHVFTFVNSVVNPKDVLIGVDINATTINLSNVLDNDSDLALFNFGGSSPSGLVTITYSLPEVNTFTISTSAGGTEITTTDLISGFATYAPTNIVIDKNKAYAYFDYETNGKFYYFKVNNLKNYDESLTYTSTDFTTLGTSEIDYDINEILTTSPSLGYKDEFHTTYTKGYKRGEQYSLGLKVKFKDGSDSYVYHIPGSDMNTSTTTEATPDNPSLKEGNTTGTLGTYMSSIDYPLNQYLPGSRAGDDNVIQGVTVSNNKIRHHKMPTLLQEPHFRHEYVKGPNNKIDGYNIWIRILGLEFEFRLPFSEDLADKIQSVSIVRESRERTGNKSVEAQGFGIPMLSVYSDIDVDAGSVVYDDPVLIKNPYFGKLEVSSWEADFIEAPGFDNDVAMMQLPENEGLKNDYVSFYSPDISLANRTNIGFTGMTLKAVFGINGVTKVMYQDGINAKYQSKYGITSYPDESVKHEIDFMLGSWWQQCSYLRTDNTIHSDVSTELESIITDSNKITTNNKVTVDSDVVYNTNSSEFLLLKTDVKTGFTQNATSTGTEDRKTTLYFEPEYDYYNGESFKTIYDEITTNDDIYKNRDSVDVEATSSLLNILEIVNEAEGQYGELSNTEYIECLTTTSIPVAIGTAIGNVYGGDIFITPFSVTNKQTLPIQSSVVDVNPQPYPDKAVIRWTDETFRIQGGIPPTEDIEPLPGFDARCLYYMFLESNVNCDFRHEFKDDDGVLQTRYFPKSSAYDVAKVAIEKGECISYNPQYSIENAVKTFFSKSLTGEITGDFENRIIYSDNASLDSIVDNYKQFPVNNYQDIPKHTGEIWDLFVYNDTLYSHTPKSLWRMFNKNNSTMTSSDISEVILGTGDAYTIDAQRRTDFKGGYAGTISQFAGVHTPAGYIFPDALQGKIFLFTPGSKQGDLQELSRDGMLTFFNKNLRTSLIDNNGNYIDNPYTGYGILANYDFTLKRYLITKKDEFNGFTYSFSFVGNCWLSSHDYRPDCYIVLDNELYMLDNTWSKIYKANEGEKGDFKTLDPVSYAINDSTIRFIVNENIDVTKVFDNIVFNTNSYDSNGEYIPMETFSTIQVSNDLQDTSEKTIIVNNDYPTLTNNQVQCKFKNNEYRLAVPRNTDDTRIKSKYSIIDLKYDNSNDNKFVINFIKTLFRINRR